jgi:hypothetical protein
MDSGGVLGMTKRLFRQLVTGASIRKRDSLGRSHNRERNHKDFPARKSASLVRKKSETRMDTEEMTTA